MYARDLGLLQRKMGHLFSIN